MRLRGFIRSCIVFIGLLCAVFLVYFLVGAKSSVEVFKQYDSIKPGVTSSYSKSLQFLATYLISSGDDSIALEMGLSKDDIDSLKEPYTEEQDDGDEEENNGPVIGDSVLAASSAVAERFKKSGTPSYTKSGWTNPGGLFFNYSQRAGSYAPIEYDGKTVSTTHRDCSCYCSAMRYLLNMDSRFVHRTSSTFNDQLSNVTSEIRKFSDCRVGDVLWRSGHVAMVVKIDSEFVYVGDCGSGETSDHSQGTVGSDIDKTANQGYAYTFSINDSFSGNNKRFVKVLR